MLSAFSYAYSTCLSSLVGIQIFCQYFRFLLFFFFFLLSLDRSPLSNICFAKYFSQSVTCLSTLLGVILIFLNYLFTYIFGCSGSSLPHRVFSCCSAQASHCSGSSCSEHWLQVPRLPQLWLMGSAAPQHVGSSWTRARPRVPYMGRWILNHWATREVQESYYFECKLIVFDLQGSVFHCGIILVPVLASFTK